MLVEIMRGQLIERAVGNNMDNDEGDVRRIKRALSLIGPFDIGTPPEPHSIITREMDSAIKDFQTSENLRIDGVLKPGGETEGALLGSVSNVVLSRIVPLQRQNTNPLAHVTLPELEEEEKPQQKEEEFELDIDEPLSAEGGENSGEDAQSEEKPPPLPERKPDQSEDDSSQNDRKDNGDSNKDDPDQGDGEEKDCSDLEAALEEAQVRFEEVKAVLLEAKSELDDVQTALNLLREELSKLNQKNKCALEREALVKAKETRQAKQIEVGSLQAEANLLQAELKEASGNAFKNSFIAGVEIAIKKKPGLISGGQVVASTMKKERVARELKAVQQKLERAKTELKVAQEVVDNAMKALQACKVGSEE